MRKRKTAGTARVTAFASRAVRVELAACEVKLVLTRGDMKRGARGGGGG